MRQLVVHPGYSKTATTHLQERCFVPLHVAGKINFLGKSIHREYPECHEQARLISMLIFGDSGHTLSPVHPKYRTSTEINQANIHGKICGKRGYFSGLLREDVVNWPAPGFVDTHLN